MADRPKCFVIEDDGGKRIELNEDDTRMLYELADGEGVEPIIFLKSLVRSTDLLLRHGLIKPGNKT